MVWLRASTTLVRDRRKIFETAFPSFEDLTVIEGAILNRTVGRAGIDFTNNSLRLLVGDILLSVFPGTKSSELSWMLFDDRLTPPSVIVAFADSLEFKAADRDISYPQ
jgi:hypothetical protein